MKLLSPTDPNIFALRKPPDSGKNSPYCPVKDEKVPYSLIGMHLNLSTPDTLS